MSNEDKITSWFAAQSRAAAARFPIGIGDDMAQVRSGPDGTVLITTDMLLDGVHFDLSQCTLRQASYKAMAASLSDCAAMATVPLCAVVAVALPVDFGPEQLRHIHAGVTDAGSPFDCELIGGDITKWNRPADRFVINVTMLSEPSAHHPPVRRSGARVGDTICVTGALGGSLAGRHLNFVPRVSEALQITRAARVHAMMDITDGLAADLNRICTQSRTGALLNRTDLPMSDAARQSPDPYHAVYYDGEDFELLFTLAPGEAARLPALEGVPITRIGTVTDTRKIQVRQPDGRIEALPPGGYDHL